MSDPHFFETPPAFTLEFVLSVTKAQAPQDADLSLSFQTLSTLAEAGPADLVFLDNPRYAPLLQQTRARACLLAPRFARSCPASVIPLVTSEPYHAFGHLMRALYPAALRPGSFFETKGVASGAFIHPTARLEADVSVDPGAVIGPRAEIGQGTVVGAHAVIGPDVRIGRFCSIGPSATISHALIGNHVILQPGVRVGQDGFGFAMGPSGHLKIPQIGRVIIQDHVEIGANATISRGALKDTVIGEGSRIDALVQIAHNVMMGRHCVIVAQSGISGSTELGDFVALGGQAGVTGHLKIGTGAQIAAQAGVMTSVPPGERWGGAPAQPLRQFFRTVAALNRLSQKESSSGAGDS